MGNLIKSLKRIYTGFIYCAWIVNIQLLIWGSMNHNYDLQILSLINMILLSFVLLRESNTEAE
jgi:hypothetical protein